MKHGNMKEKILINFSPSVLSSKKFFNLTEMLKCEKIDRTGAL